MALIKCKECDNEVSSKAKTCPRCGAKVKKKIGILGWIGIFVVGGIAIPAIVPGGGTKTAAPAERKISPKLEALQALQLQNYNGYKGGFGSVLFIDADFKNSGTRDVKDIQLTCAHFSNSDTQIDSSSKTIFEVIPAGKKKSIRKFNMGFVHSQAKKTTCYVTNLELV